MYRQKETYLFVTLSQSKRKLFIRNSFGTKVLELFMNLSDSIDIYKRDNNICPNI